MNAKVDTKNVIIRNGVSEITETETDWVVRVFACRLYRHKQKNNFNKTPRAAFDSERRKNDNEQVNDFPNHALCEAGRYSSSISGHRFGLPSKEDSAPETGLGFLSQHRQMPKTTDVTEQQLFRCNAPQCGF